MSTSSERPESRGNYSASGGAKRDEANSAYLLFALVATKTAIAYLDRQAHETDNPPTGLVEAADHLDAAGRSLARAIRQ